MPPAINSNTATVIRKCPPRNGNLTGSPNSTVTRAVGAVAAAATATPCHRRVGRPATATAIAPTPRNAPATGLTSGASAAASIASSNRSRRQQRTAIRAHAKPNTNGARPTTTLTTIASAKTWLASDVVGDGNRSSVSREKQCVATMVPIATTANGSSSAINGGANTLYGRVACPAYQKLFHTVPWACSHTRART